MGIFFDKNKFKSLLELKINGEEMNYDDEENNEDKPEGEGEDNTDNTDNTEEPIAEDDVEEEPENDYKIDDAENDAANDTEDATATIEEPSEDATENDYKIDDAENDTANDEFEGNPEDNTDTEEEPVDDTEDDYKIDDAENDAANDDTPDDGTDTTEDDYKIDDVDGETPEGEEAPTDTAIDDETSVDSEGGTDKSSELKDIEKELFKDLSPEQIQIREKELKSKYLELYNTINDIITRTGNIAKTSANAKLLNFIVDKLFELKNLLFFYMENTYITKSYMENSVNYQQCLATLSMINKLFDEMKNKK